MRRWLFIACFGAACSGSSHSAAHPPSVTTAESIFGDRCQTCHGDKVEGRPQFATTQLDPRVANQALRAVLAGQMPPSEEDQLSYAELDSLSGWLCERTQRTQDDCRGIVEAGRPARPADVFLRTIQVPARGLEGPWGPDAALKEYLRPASTETKLDPTYMMFASLIALELCQGEAQIDVCYARVLDAAEAMPPLPAPPRGAP